MIAGQICGPYTYLLRVSALINMYVVGGYLLILKDIYQENSNYLIYWKEF